MEGFVATKLTEFEQGKISRRKLLDTLTLAVTAVYAAGESHAAAVNPALKVTHVDHISYTCPNFRKAADWYSSFFNLDQVDATSVDVSLPFDKKGSRSNDVSAGNAARTHLIIREPSERVQGVNGSAPPRKSKARVDHVAYTIADFSQERVRAELKRMGIPDPRKDGEHSFHIVDLNGFDVQISGIEMTALRG